MSISILGGCSAEVLHDVSEPQSQCREEIRVDGWVTVQPGSHEKA